MLDRVLHRATQVSRAVVWVGGALLIFAAVITTIDVLLRKFLSWSFGGADEIAGYLFAIATAFALGLTLLDRTHVRIDAFYMILPARLRSVLDILAFLALGSFIFFITERAYSVWWGSYENSSVSITPLVTPLAIPQGFWLAGLAFSSVIVVLIALRAVVAVFKRDWPRLSALLGTRTLEEDVAEETGDASSRSGRGGGPGQAASGE